ncbi:MAG: bifunctional riboflavin kinase/FAD synthetase [Anaerolineales bacterium]|nr:bifunctional riboflavin kinase/FAD synthetase [Anaerolineales bacterium]
MQLHWSLQHLQLQGAWLTIGSFDGVHKGHQAIVKALTAGAHAESAPAVVLTFHPHPAAVLRGRKGAYYLTSPEERATLLAELGVDVVIVHTFDQQVANLSARDFIANLHRRLDMRRLCVGQDFALGRGRQGDIPALERLGDEFGYRLQVIGPVNLDGQSVSSSRIRLALAEGDAPLARRLLGRPYRASGAVVHGDGRGRKLGIPTANLEVWAERILPKVGVYACLAQVGGQSWKTVANVGVRPTFQAADAPLLEAHLLDYQGDLYQQEISLSFVQRLRDEQRFPSAEALAAQIQRDIQQARELLDAGAP